MKTRHWIYAIALVLLIALYYAARFSIEQFFHARSDDRALAAIAKSHGGTIGQKVSERVIVRQLPPKLIEFVRVVKETVPSARIDSSSSTTATVNTTVPTVQTGNRLCDQWKRFCFELPGGLLTQRQEIRIATVFVRSADGKVRVAKSDFQEFAPDTHEPIPTTGVELKTDYSFTDEPKSLPPFFHPRAMLGVDHRAAFGGGVELVNLERTRIPIMEKLSGGIIGYLKREKTEGRAGVQVSYRLFETNFLLGGYIGATIPSGALVGGVAASVELTK